MKTSLREYQREVLDWAYSSIKKKAGAVCCLPTATGKTIVFIAMAERMLREGMQRVLVLEPTRYLVEQTGKRFNYEISAEGFSVSYIHSGVKERNWWSSVIITTPESALAHIQESYPGLSLEDGSPSKEFPLVIIDECHHTIGLDPFAKVMRYLRMSIKVGFSAIVIQRKRSEIERLIGPLKIWTFKDLEGKGYEKPPMIADVYDSPLTEAEAKLYKMLYDLRFRGDEASRFAALAMTTLARDGAEALRESAEKPTRLGEFLRSLGVPDAIPGGSHKLDALRRILEDYEGNYNKAIVFVHRLITSDTIARELSHLKPERITGGITDPKAKERLLERVRDPSVKLIVATAAGDEGIDIPEIDLMVFWSHMVAPTRFYQRLGRGLRMLKVPGIVKKAIFISTPETRDYDTLHESLYALEEEGVDVAGIFERLPVLPTESKRLADTIAEYASRTGGVYVPYGLLKSIVPKEGEEPSVPEEIEYLRMLVWKSFFEELLPEELRQYALKESVSKYEKRLRSQLVKAVSEGHLCYFYDIGVVSTVLEEIAYRLSVKGVGKLRLGFLQIILGIEYRCYVRTEDLSKLSKERTEDFSDMPLSVTVKSGKRTLKRYFQKSPREIVNELTRLDSRVKVTIHPSINGYITTDGHRIESSLTTVYGPFMIKNKHQIEFSLRNASALSALLQ
ncbi:MAG: DEAD/DEAH box helicase family protein [Thermosphaera sp.]